MPAASGRTKKSVVNPQPLAPHTTESITLEVGSHVHITAEMKDGGDSHSLSISASTSTKKKATKKPVKVVAVVTSEGIEGSFTPEPRRPLIAHLQIKPKDVRFTEGGVVGLEALSSGGADYGDLECESMEINGDHSKAAMASSPITTSLQPTKDDSVNTSCISAAAAAAAPPPCFTRHNLMIQYKESSDQKRLPERTDIACFWCAHSFEWQPCIIPEREVGGVYQVYGNFCTPQCGVAYLLSEAIDPHVRWERMALLQRIYDQDGKGRICPAPARETLSLFGGPLSIDSFRATVKEKKIRIDLHMPPMVSILGSIDTKPIDFFDVSNRSGASSALTPAQHPQRSVEEGLRLKRSKPLKDRESTLDTVMNIRIGSSKKK